MNCEWVKENVILYVYEELADDSRIELEQHAEHCPACAAEIAAARGFHQEMSARPQVELSPNWEKSFETGRVVMEGPSEVLRKDDATAVATPASRTTRFVIPLCRVKAQTSASENV